MTAGDSITYQPQGWQEVDGVIVPRREETAPVSAQKSEPAVVHKQVPRPRQYKFTTEAVGIWRADAAAPAAAKAAAKAEAPDDAHAAEASRQVGAGIITVVDDSAADSAAEEAAPVYGMVVESPIIREDPIATVKFDSMSWVFLGLSVLFCAVCLKFKSNTRYLKALMDDMTDVRMRTNLFDDTVKETSFLVLLNVMWVACAGVLLWKTIWYFSGHPVIGDSLSLDLTQTEGAGISIGMAAVYSVFMLLAYWIVGSVFSDRKRTVMWVKGAAASQGMEVIFFFPLALLAMCYAPWTGTVLIIAAAVFVIVKIVFIYKGFRIFFNEISSWMLFLYYLCSLEIVPLIMSYAGALWLCSLLH